MADHGYKDLTDDLDAAKKALELYIAIYYKWKNTLRDVRARLAVLSTGPKSRSQIAPTTEEYWGAHFKWRAELRLAIRAEKNHVVFVQDILRTVRQRQAAYNNIRRRMGLEVPSHDPWAGEEQENLRGRPQAANNWNWTEEPPQERPPSAWELAVDKALQDRAAMTVFPDPPASQCSKPRCSLQRQQRVLDACECDIEAALKLDPKYPESLRVARVQWHPDKFRVCPEEYVELFEKKAAEIFIVANRLFEGRH